MRVSVFWTYIVLTRKAFFASFISLFALVKGYGKSQMPLHGMPVSLSRSLRLVCLTGNAKLAVGDEFYGRFLWWFLCFLV